MSPVQHHRSRTVRVAAVNDEEPKNAIFNVNTAFPVQVDPRIIG